MTNEIFTLIGTYGFPIVVSIYLLWERRKTEKENFEAFTEAINNNSTKTRTVIENNNTILGTIAELMRDCKESNKNAK